MNSENTGAASRRTKAPLPFFSYDSTSAPLFSINENVPLDALVDQAQCFMLSVEECALKAAEEIDHPSAWAAYYMAQIGSALIEAMQYSLAKESRHE